MAKQRAAIGYSTPKSQKQKPPLLNGLLAVLTGMILLGGCVLSCGGLLLNSDSPSPDHLKFFITALGLVIISIIALVIGSWFDKQANHRKAQFICVLPILALLTFLTLNRMWHGFHLLDNLFFTLKQWR